jgi:RimJ/RimL family protein N-acetyltransferase
MERIETSSLVLEPLTRADYPWLIEMYSDAEVMRYIGDGPRSPEESREKLDWLLDLAARLDLGCWVLRDRQTGEPAGTVMLMVRKPGGTVELGFALARAAWGRGFATEASRAVLGLAFGKLDLPEVEAFTHADNAASGAVLRKAGMRETGLSTGPYGHVDRRYAATRAEWGSLLGE